MSSRKSPTSLSVDLVLDALAVFRLSRLIVADSILDEPRGKLLVHLESNGHSKLAYLIGCPWCISFHTAIFVVCARRLGPKAWSPIAKVLAASAVTGLLSADT
jgi:hypothetical protein